MRSNDEMSELFDRIQELKPSDFGNSILTERHLCFTNEKRIEINKMMMHRDLKKKKRKPLVIEKNKDDPNSQDVQLLVGSPVMSVRNRASLGLVNGATFVVKKLDPLTLKDTLTNSIVKITPEVFQEFFYINHCSTVHKSQGETINILFTIHQWSRMSKEMKYRQFLERQINL